MRFQFVTTSNWLIFYSSLLLPAISQVPSSLCLNLKIYADVYLLDFAMIYRIPLQVNYSHVKEIFNLRAQLFVWSFYLTWQQIEGRQWSTKGTVVWKYRVQLVRYSMLYPLLNIELCLFEKLNWWDNRSYNFWAPHLFITVIHQASHFYISVVIEREGY